MAVDSPTDEERGQDEHRGLHVGTVIIDELITPPTKEKVVVARPYEAYSISDLLRLKLSFMRKYAEPEKITEQLEYVKALAQQNTLISNASYLSLLTVDKDRNNPILDKGEINKAIYQYLEQFKITDEDLNKQVALLEAGLDDVNQAVPEQSNTLEDDIEDTSNNINGCLRDIASYERDILSFQNNLNSYNKTMDRLELELDQMNAQDNIAVEYWVVTEIRKVIAAGDWLFTGFHQGKFHLISASDIICRHYLPAAGIDKSLDFGRFALSISMVGELSCRVLTNGIKLGDQRRDPFDNPEHPHISRGSICWGNMRTAIGNMRTNRQILAQVNILNQLLREYSANAPYRKFGSFLRRRKDRESRNPYFIDAMYGSVASILLYPEHVPFNVDDYEHDSTVSGFDNLPVGTYINRNHNRTYRIEEINESGYRRFRYKVLNLSDGRLHNINSNDIDYVYKLKETPDVETEEEQTEPLNITSLPSIPEGLTADRFGETQHPSAEEIAERASNGWFWTGQHWNRSRQSEADQAISF